MIGPWALGGLARVAAPRQMERSAVLTRNINRRLHPRFTLEPMYTPVAVRTLDLTKKGSHWPLEVQVFRLDADTAIVCLPCEIFVELGLAIKQASPFKRTIVISICNDRPSYVPTKKAFTEGSYEITNARVKPGVGESLVETAVELLKKLK